MIFGASVGKAGVKMGILGPQSRQKGTCLHTDRTSTGTEVIFALDSDIMTDIPDT